MLPCLRTKMKPSVIFLNRRIDRISISTQRFKRISLVECLPTRSLWVCLCSDVLGKVIRLSFFSFLVSNSNRRCLGVTSPDLNGFLQPAANEAPNGTWEKAFVDYDDLKKNYISSHQRYWDEQSKVPSLFNQSTGSWISYDDLESTKWKVGYIRKHRLRGIFFWELSKDRSGELLGAAFNALNSSFELLPTNLCAPLRHSSSTETTHV